MTDFRERYKRLGFDPEANRALRSQRRDEARRGFRDEQMSLRRDMDAHGGDDSYSLDDNLTPNTQESGLSAFSQDSSNCKGADSQEDSKSKAAAEHEAAVQQRWERLQKWREEKNKRKQIEKKKAKPVFKVGVVHHRVYSPPVNKEPAPVPPPKLCKSRDISANMSQTAPKRVTRATEKRLAVKNIVNQQKRENIRTKKKMQPQVHDQGDKDKHMEIAPKDHMFKAPVGLTPMPIFGRQALEATKANIEAEISSFQIPTTANPGAFSESFNESALSLKLSSDDQEMLDDSMTNEAKSPVSRRSSKNLSPPAADEAVVKGVTSDDQEMMEVEQFSNTEKRNSSFSAQDKIQSPLNKKSPVQVSSAKDDSILSKQDNETPSRKRKSIAVVPQEISSDSPRHTRSTRAADKRRSVRIVSTDSADSGIEPSLTPDEPSTSRRQSMKVASVDSETDSIASPGKKANQPTSRRRSSSKVENVEESVSIPKKTPANNRRSTKFIASGSIDNEEDAFTKPAESRRRSMKIPQETEVLNSSNIVTIADVHQSPLANQTPDVLHKSSLRKKSTRFTTTGQENIEFNNTNLMDFTFTAPATLLKAADVPKSLLDDTVSNLTPRRSPRLPPTTTTSNVDEDQPLIRFSSFYVPPSNRNESSNSEPIQQHSPNEMMNLSLNMSLPKESEEEDKPPAFFSPYIVQSRGKNSARKEIKKRRFSQPRLETDDIPTKDNIMQKLNISVEEEERTAQYYKLILSKEIERLNELCDRWYEIKKNAEIPEESRYIIQAAVGQTQLLINKKFERFRSLVHDCETGRGEMLVTCKDLQGFWEMMYMEINDCDNRFNKLEEMKANSWIIKEDEAALDKKKKKAPAKKPATKKPAVSKPSSLRAMIAAARKKKAEARGGVKGSEETTTEPVEKPIEEPSESEKPASPAKTNTRMSSTPKSSSKWDNLLKKVQLSQTRKSTTSPLVVMKLSQMVKTPEVQLDDSIVYINSARTPAKSILKKDEVMGSVSKSTNKVFFREQSNEVKEFEIRNSFVDSNISLDNIEEIKEPIERKLNFEDDSFVEITEDKDEPSESQFVLSAGSPKSSKEVSLTTSPMISMSPLSLEDKTTESSGTQKKSTRTKKQISFKQDVVESQPRSLRTRKFSAPLTPKTKRRDQNDLEEDVSMEVSNAANQSNGDTPRPKFIKEIYLNAQGVVCERLVPVQKSTPATARLKRSVSDAAHKNRQNSKILEFDELINSPVTPRARRRNTNVPEIQVTTPKSVLKELPDKINSSSPRLRKQSLKRSLADTTLTQDSVDVSMEDIKTPKMSKRTPKSELKESSTKSSTLKRTRSLKVTDNEENNVKQTASPKLRRTKSLNMKKVDAEDSPKEALKRKSLKKLQENIEPNEQETDRNAKGKLSKTPSFNRKSTKKQVEVTDPSEKLTDVSDTVSDTMTPNTRRKSLRITRASMKG